MTLSSFAASRAGRRFTAVVAAFAPLVFLVAEAITAIAWTAGTYDYGHNFISDLGTTVCGSEFSGRDMCSPAHAVMNFGFVAMGLGVAATAALLATRLPRGRRITATALGCFIAIGMILVATFHGGVESVDNGTIALHVLGAGIAISFGNSLAIITGANTARLRFARWYRPTAISLGIVGLIGLVLLVSGLELLDPAVFERISVYAIFAWLLATSAAQLQANRAAGGSE